MVAEVMENREIIPKNYKESLEKVHPKKAMDEEFNALIYRKQYLGLSFSKTSY